MVAQVQNDPFCLHSYLNPYSPVSPDEPFDAPAIYDETGNVVGGPMMYGEPKTGEMHLDMNVSKKDPIAWGWMFDSSDYESGDLYRSLIIENDGRPSAK